jgi:alpha-N-arabinofuranosidase
MTDRTKERSVSRREFLTASVSSGLSLLAAASPGKAARHNGSRPGAAAVDSRIEILVDEKIGVIAPEIHGHFAEHLGAVIYDGIWVGEGSKIPNVNGIRKALIDALVRIKAPVIRWPGGCFADSYDWRDGVGSPGARPRRTNFWAGASEWPKGVTDGPWKYDTNRFGTNEFAQFCRLTGAEPYFAANLRSLSAKDFYQWVEYCNSPAGSTSLADARAAGGMRDPLNVRYWGVGNESWGCGGNFTPEEYASEYRRFTEWVPGFGVKLAFIGAGPNGGEIEWTRRFFTKLAERRAVGRMWGWALHHYSWNVSGGRTNDWRQGKGDAIDFPAEQWYELLREADKMESLITDHWAVMGEYDRQHQVKLVVDEWGAWYKPGTESYETHLLGQQSTMRDAVLAGLSLDTFHRQADKVAMANVAQLINCLQSLFLAHEDQFVLTPTFHVFEMYASHKGGQSLRTMISSPRSSYTRNGAPASIRGLSGSASVRDKQLVLTVTNPDLEQPRECEIAVRGAAIRSGGVTTLSATDVRAHNSFRAPNRVEPASSRLSTTGSSVVHKFPAASVTRLVLELA